MSECATGWRAGGTVVLHPPPGFLFQKALRDRRPAELSFYHIPQHFLIDSQRDAVI